MGDAPFSGSIPYVWEYAGIPSLLQSLFITAWVLFGIFSFCMGDLRELLSSFGLWRGVIWEVLSSELLAGIGWDSF